MSTLGRHVPLRGSPHGGAKLTEEDVIEIRLLYNGGGMSYSDPAARFGVDRANISLIIKRKAWQHVA